MSDDQRANDSLRRRLMDLATPIAKRALHGTPFAPSPATRWLFRTAFEAGVVSRELAEWALRSFVATPMFLARCAVHGDNITVDAPPAIGGKCRVEVGSDVRIAGKLEVQSGLRAGPILKIGNGVFIGHGCILGVAERIDIGSYVSIGAFTFISDTAGHSHQLLDPPIWGDRAWPGDVARVIIEDNAYIGRGCVILKGVRIGARAVIGAGSVVRSDVQPEAIVAGNPARVVGWRRGTDAAAAVTMRSVPTEPTVEQAPVSRVEAAASGVEAAVSGMDAAISGVGPTGETLRSSVRVA
jgi:acetyltransferase-like isoleucine patch superfamily enzyme